MCHACKHPLNNLANTNPETVVEDFGFTHDVLTWLAPQQRANLEHAVRCLCERHYENYEQVVRALEGALLEEGVRGNGDLDWIKTERCDKSVLGI